MDTLLMASGSTGTGAAWVGVVAALITVAGTRLGWLSVRREENRQRAIESEPKYREQQIQEFYGPLYSLALQIRRADEVQKIFINDLEKRVKDGSCKPEEKEDKERNVRALFRAKYFEPLHTDMIQILKGKLYLVEAPEVLASLKKYLKHTIDDRARTELEEKLGTFPQEWVEWPETLEEKLWYGLRTAMQERHKLLSRRRKVVGFGQTADDA